MPITMELRDNDRVIYYQITDPWQFDEALTAYKLNNDLRNQHKHKIHTIANISGTRHIPNDVLRLRLFSPDIMHPRAGIAFLVGPSPFARSIIDLIVRLLKTQKIRVVATEEEAWVAVRKIIKSETAELPQADGLV